MERRHELRLTQKQTLIMTQKLRQALKLLTLPTLELREELKTELQTNPLLEEVEEVTEAPETRLEAESAEPAEPENEGPDEVDWESYLQDASDAGTVPTPERQEERYERVNIVTLTLTDVLREQLYVKKLGPEDEAVMEFILGSLDDRGFLTLTNEEIVEHTGTEPERVARLVGMLQDCEPAGIGARDLRECLLLQLVQNDGDAASLARRIVEEHWENLKNRRLPDISRTVHVSVRDVQDAVDHIATLNPSPGGQIAGDEARYVYPDLVVERVGEDYVVSLNDRNVPRLRINRAYEKVLLSQSEGDDKTRSFVKSKLKSARWIVQTIEQRRRTMVRVMTKIVEKQRAFFDHGVLHLKPLTLQDVAREIDMHESTVSRVTSGKYVQTPRGVFELKFFFSSGLGTSEGEDISSKAAKEKIARLIEDEDRRHPLSDQKIADMLQAEGVDIARRTVAKYREAMGVPSARLRKRH
jgi:RNA polymerase sigma-54 factor